MHGAALGTRDVVIDHAELIRVGAAIALHGEGFPAPDQLRAALAEMLPATKRVLAGRAVGVSVPSFHRMDAPAVADDETTDVQRLRQRTSLRGRQRPRIERQIDPENFKPRFQFLHLTKMSDLGDRLICFRPGRHMPAE